MKLWLLAISTHHWWDVLFCLWFIVGELLFMLSRAGKALRNGRVTKRRQFFCQNWDILLIRGAIEIATIFMGYRHLSIDQITELVGWQVSAYHMPQAAFVYFLLGFFADALADHIAILPRVPDWVKKLIADNIPPAPPALGD